MEAEKPFSRNGLVINMQKAINDFSTLVKMSTEEAKEVCRLGQMDKCCAFLVMSSEGFECCRMVEGLSWPIIQLLKIGNMNAKGEGGWKGCAWEGKI